MTTETPIQKLARATAAATQGTKGKPRDRMAIAFWFGAAQGAALAGDNDTAHWIQRVGVFLIGTRGYSEIERIVAEADAQAKGDAA